MKLTTAQQLSSEIYSYTVRILAISMYNLLFIFSNILLSPSIFVQKLIMPELMFGLQFIFSWDSSSVKSMTRTSLTLKRLKECWTMARDITCKFSITLGLKVSQQFNVVSITEVHWCSLLQVQSGNEELAKINALQEGS